MSDGTGVPDSSRREQRLTRWYTRHVLRLSRGDPPGVARRLVREKDFLRRHSAQYAVLWPVLRDALLEPRIAVTLTDPDWAALENTARLLAAGSDGRLGASQSWQPIRDARAALEEKRRAPEVLAELWQGPSGTLADLWTLTLELARHRASSGLAEVTAVATADTAAPGQERIPGASPRISGALTEALEIGLRSDAYRVWRAVELVTYLRDLGIRVREYSRVLGLASVLHDRVDDTLAEEHLTAAHEADPADGDVRAALMAVLIRDGRPAEASAIAASTPAARGPAAELAELSTILTWLDDVTAAGPAPSSSKRLRELSATAATITADVTGDWLRYATGRLCLIEGDTRAAATLLVPLARADPARPERAYHAAAALALLGDRPRARELWNRVRSRSSAWPVGCQLMDMDSGFDDPPVIPSAYADVMSVRTALRSSASLPPAPAAWHPAGGTASADMEAFRTCLAHWLAEGDQQALGAALDLPVFARLPAPERMLWAGIATLPRYRDGGHALLGRAARLGHPRAVLVLQMLLGEDGPAPGTVVNDGASAATGPVPDLVAAWTQAQSGQRNEARRLLLRVLRDREAARQRNAAGDPRVRYMLAADDLVRAAQAETHGRADDARRHATDSAGQLRTLLASPSPPRFAGEAKVLLRHAEILAGKPAPDQTTAPGRPSDEVPGWFSPASSTWFRALAAMARLADGAGQPEDAHLLADVLGPPADVPRAVLLSAATLISRACVAGAGHARQSEELRTALFRLTVRLPKSRTAYRLYGMAAAALWRADGDPRDGSGSAFPEVALALAERAIRAGRSPTAAAALRAVRTPDQASADICRVLADLAEGRPLPADLPSTGGPGTLVTAATTALADVADDPLVRGKALLTLLREPGTAATVNVPANLPALCAAIASSRTSAAPEPVASAVRALTGRPPDSLPPVVAAQCATAIGAPEAAHRLWARALKADGGASSALREEAAQALRYTAVRARQDGDDQRAAWSLRMAGESRLAAVLELQETTTRLISLLFPWTGHDRGDRPGRYRVLEEAIDGDAALKAAIAAGDPRHLRTFWTACLRARSDDLRFLHAAAVLYRENALAGLGDPAADSALATATTLWSLLLSADEFWRRFPGLTADDGLADRVLDSLLIAHVTAGSRALTAGDRATAGMHFQVLTACVVGHDALASQLHAQSGIRWRRPSGTNATGHIRSLADRHIAAWGTQVADAARDALEETDGVSLPAGITRNFEGAVAILEDFASLSLRARREVALPGLQTCSKWCLAYSQEPDGEGHRTVVRVLATAGRFADQLRRVTQKGHSEHVANQAISEYYQLLGWAANDRKDKCRQFTVALEWNPGNAFALRRQKEYCDGESGGKHKS